MSKRIALSICAVIALAATPALSEEITDYGDMPIVTDTPIIYIEGEAESLRAAQQCLINLGLLTGSADGVYGPRTEAALRAFQESNDLTASGEIALDETVEGEGFTVRAIMPIREDRTKKDEEQKL